MAEYRTITVNASLTTPVIKVGSVFTTPIKVSELPPYTGPLEVTPTEHRQTLATKKKVLLENVVVNPIPSNYFDTSTADIESADLLIGKKGFGSTGTVVGTMPNNNETGGVIGEKDGRVSIPAGYTTGGEVSLVNVDALLPENVLDGKRILGVDGGIPVNGATGGSIGTKDGSVVIPEGYTTGGAVTLENVEDLVPESILSGKSILGIEGGIPVNGATGGVISTKDGSVIIPEGYTTGGTVTLENVEDLVSENVLSGKSILGVKGGIPVNGATGGSIGTKDGSVVIPEGYTTGGSVVLNGVDDLLPENVLAEKTILGIKGGIPNNGTTGGVISAKNGSVSIPEGYTKGGTVSLSGVEDLNPENLLIGKTVLGVSGKIPNNGETGGLIGSKTGRVFIPEGYTTGGTVSLTNVDDLEPKNLISGKSVLGVEGNIPNNGQTGGFINTKNGTVTIPEGYTTGGTVALQGVDDLDPSSVIAGKTILGIAGEAILPVVNQDSETKVLYIS